VSDYGHPDEPVELPSVSPDDPHLQPAARYPDRVEGLIGICFVLGIASFAVFGAAYWQNLKPIWLAVSFGAGLFFLGFGLTAWGKYLMPQGPFVEDRHELAGTQAEQDSLSAALVDRTTLAVTRRGLLGILFAAGAAVFGIVLMFPLLRSLGPLPKKSLDTTNWRRGVRLVDSSGRPIRVSEVVQGGLVTVFPEGLENTDDGQAIDQTVLLRPTTAPTKPGTNIPLPGTPHGYVAYSKLCTHLGCPVGLYEKELNYLVCPCHQSMFDIADNAEPIFGPAPRPLPRLPLQVGEGGYLEAAAGYDQPVGPGFWERS
jgi:ubiquinol-cytochrome c reductase iron-sulfur subunit